MSVNRDPVSCRFPTTEYYAAAYEAVRRQVLATPWGPSPPLTCGGGGGGVTSSGAAALENPLAAI